MLKWVTFLVVAFLAFRIVEKVDFGSASLPGTSKPPISVSSGGRTLPTAAVRGASPPVVSQPKASEPVVAAAPAAVPVPVAPQSAPVPVEVKPSQEQLDAATKPLVVAAQPAELPALVIPTPVTVAAENVTFHDNRWWVQYKGREVFLTSTGRPSDAQVAEVLGLLKTGFIPGEPIQ